MRIATWNVNSVRSRASRIVDTLKRHDIDVLAMQETKTRDESFPYDAFAEEGYECAHVGYNQWNGVAICSRVGLSDVAEGFPGQPGFAKDPAAEQRVEARAVGATCGGVRLWSLYVPNGREVTDRHYAYKLSWLWRLGDYVAGELRREPGQRLAIMGDFNVAPRDEDAWNIEFFAGKTHATEPERAAFEELGEEAGLNEVSRQFTKKERFTYWDYQDLRFPRNEGVRIDFQLASPTLAKEATAGFVDVEERAAKGASDHAPVVVDYDLPPNFDDVR